MQPNYTQQPQMYSYPLDNNSGSINPKRESSLRAMRMQSGYQNSYISPEALARLNDPFADPIQGNRILISSRMRKTEDTSSSSFTIPLSTTLTNTSAIRIMNVDIPVSGNTINTDNDTLYFSEEVDSSIGIVNGGGPAFNLFAARIPHGVYSATDLANIASTSMQCAQCLSATIVSPANIYSCTYEDTCSSTIRIAAIPGPNMNNVTPFTVLAPTNPQGTIMNHMNNIQVTSILWNAGTNKLTIVTKSKSHGILSGDTIYMLVIRPQFIDTITNNQRYKAPNLTIQNHPITKTDQCDPNSNFISITIDPLKFAAFTDAGITAIPNDTFMIMESSYLSTVAMDRNIGKTLGFTKSTTQSVFEIIGISWNPLSDIATFVTSSPHAFTVGSTVTIIVQGQTLQNQAVTTIQNIQSFSINYPLFTNNIAPAGSLVGAIAYLTDGIIGTTSTLAVSPKKVDLSLQSRDVLIYCKINRTQEVGNFFVPGVNNRFLARVQLTCEPNSFQFNLNADHIVGVFQLDLPIQKINSVTVSLYNETGLLLYDTNGVEWSAVFEFMCDNNGNQ